MYTLISVIFGLVGCALLTSEPALGFLSLAIGTLVFIRWNRLAAKKVQERQHQELVEAVRNSGAQ